MDMNATTRALTTVELLEKLLSCMRFLDIRNAQRVNRLWRDTVEDSLLLQRRLFRAADSAADAPCMRRFSRYIVQPVTVNSLVLNIFRIRHSGISGSSIMLLPPRNKRKLQQAAVPENVLKRKSYSDELDGIADRPLILDEPKFYKGSVAGSRHYTESYDIEGRSILAVLGSDRRSQARRPHAYRRNNWPSRLATKPTCRHDNWASMLATQPPIKVLNLRCDSLGGHHGGVKVIAADGVGITLGDLVEAVAEFYRTRAHQQGPEYRFDAELTVYQPLDVELPKNPGRLQVYSAQGRRVTVDKDQGIGFQRLGRRS